MNQYDLKKELERLHRNYSETSMEDEFRRAEEDLKATEKYAQAVRDQLARVRRNVMKPIPYLHRQSLFPAAGRSPITSASTGNPRSPCWIAIPMRNPTPRLRTVSAWRAVA